MPSSGTLQGALSRPDWRPGGALTAEELNLAHRYLAQRLRQHDRLSHGWGIVCGLNLVATGAELLICPGYGIGPCGDEIFLPAARRFNLRDYLWTRPLDASSRRAWIGLESSIPSAPEPCKCVGGCGCGGTPGGEARIADTIRIEVTWSPPLWATTPATFDICGGGAPACPVCPPTCALPIGSIAVPPEWER